MNTVPHISEMPPGWLAEDLDSGLGPEELSPDSKFTFYDIFHHYLFTFDKFIKMALSLVGISMDTKYMVYHKLDKSWTVHIS